MKLIIFLLLVLINYINALKFSDVRIAQTHVIPIGGKSWVIKDKTYYQDILPGRDSLLLVKFEDQSLSYSVKIYNSDKFVGQLNLNDPSLLPPTEANGTKYSTVHHSVRIQKDWMKFGMKIQLSSSSGDVSNFIFPKMGQYNDLQMWCLPFYLFGANDTNTQPWSKINNIDPSYKAELIQKWAISDFDFKIHPLKRVDWPYIEIGPRNNNSAFVMTNTNQQYTDNDGFKLLDQVYGIIGGMRTAFGESTSAIQSYSPFLMLNSNGKEGFGPGGWGGDSRGTGDYHYSGIFIHEQGHAFGMPHAGESYNAGNFPYVNGSLLGSEWGFDANHNEFIGITIPPTAEYYKNCKQNSVLDSNGNCVKQSVMQSGAGDQAKEYRYTIFSDFEMTTIQNYFKNAIYYDSATKTYQKYNSSNGQYYNYKPITQNKGLYSIDSGTPIERDIDVYTIVFTFSVGEPKSNISQFYPLLKSKHNIIRYFDPTNKTEMAIITPNYYCHQSGCDYTIRVTYQDNSKVHILLNQGNRIYWKPLGDLKKGLYDPKSSDSFIQGVVNVRASKNIIKVELLDTPMGWNGGITNDTKVLISKSF